MELRVALREWHARIPDYHVKPGTDLAYSVGQEGPYTAMGWNIDPDAFTELLVGLSRRYPDLPLLITENGSGGSSPGCICRLGQSMV